MRTTAVHKDLRELEEQGLLIRGDKPLPADFWELARPTDPRGAVRDVVSSDREENRGSSEKGRK